MTIGQRIYVLLPTPLLDLNQIGDEEDKDVIESDEADEDSNV